MDDSIIPGDLIQVELDVEVFKMMQNEEHGGWTDRMAMVKKSCDRVHNSMTL